jgi:hypothetical protein
MNTDTTTGSLPSLVAWVLGATSVVLGVTASDSLGTGRVGAVLATFVLMGVLALSYEAVAP